SFYAELADRLSAGGELAEDEVGEYFQTNEDVMHFALVLQNRMAQKPTAAGWLMLSNIYANMGAFEQAKEAGYAAFAHDDSLDNQMWLAQIALQENGGALNAEAFMHIRSVIHAAPERNNAWLTLAMAATEAKDYDLAEEAWLELYRRNKGNVETEALFERSLQHVREQREIHAKYSQIQVRVEADATIAAGGSLFVFLRYEGSAGQPLAARRVLASKLPMTVTINRSDWLSDYPNENSPNVVVGARYNQSASRNVSDAAIVTEMMPWRQGDVTVVTLQEAQ